MKRTGELFRLGPPQNQEELPEGQVCPNKKQQQISIPNPKLGKQTRDSYIKMVRHLFDVRTEELPADEYGQVLACHLPVNGSRRSMDLFNLGPPQSQEETDELFSQFKGRPGDGPGIAQLMSTEFAVIVAAVVGEGKEPWITSMLDYKPHEFIWIGARLGATADTIRGMPERYRIKAFDAAMELLVKEEENQRLDFVAFIAKISHEDELLERRVRENYGVLRSEMERNALATSKITALMRKMLLSCQVEQSENKHRQELKSKPKM